MGCAVQKNKSLMNPQKEAFQFRQTQILQSKEQSRLQTTKSPLSSTIRPSYNKNSNPISREQKIKIEKILFDKRKNKNNNIFQFPEEEFRHQRTIIGLIIN